MAGSEFYAGEQLTEYLAHAGPSRFSPNHVMEAPAVWAAIGDAAGLRVLDLGRGDGSFGIDLMAAGAADYLGVDSSAGMIERAQQNLSATGGRAEIADLASWFAPAGGFELVAARLSLHYLADLEPILAEVVRALEPGGRFVMTVPHPVLTSRSPDNDGPRTSWLVDDYFIPGPRIRPWFGGEVVWHQRTIEQYIEAVLGSGLQLRAIRECAPVQDRFESDETEYQRRLRVPSFLLIVAELPR